MSDSILRYVPTDPFWQPSTEDAERAASLLRSLAPKAESVESRFEDEVRFYDPGENWSGVECNACGADASPYFRVFNPTLQGERFDPEGDYVRAWLPEHIVNYGKSLREYLAEP